MSEELVNRCIALPIQEKINLVAVIKASIRDDRKDKSPALQDRASFLMDCMEDVLGEPVQEKSRESRFVWARTMVAFQLIKDGFTTTCIGKMIHKDHSSISCMKRRMQDALNYSFAYKDIIDIWKQFQNRLQDDIHKGTTENSVSLGGEFPDCSQCEMGKESRQIRTPGDL